jgi:hypothetical protein
MVSQAETLNNMPIKSFTWKDRRYVSFMIHFLRALEPRQYQPGDIILRDLEEVEEITFVTHGDVSLKPSIPFI